MRGVFMGHLDLYNKNQIKDKLLLVLFLIGNCVEFLIKQKYFVQTMRTRTRRSYCFACMLGEDRKEVLLLISNVRVWESTLSCSGENTYTGLVHFIDH